ncbi:hypothetical protein SAMN06272781_1252 [Streptomyces sp. 1222.2]|nr:hypothetical protein SAMN06272781_1252 [Streptomyces sp. 1222.2]
MVRSLNANTFDLKHGIRDNWGAQGEQWYEALEERIEQAREERRAIAATRSPETVRLPYRRRRPRSAGHGAGPPTRPSDSPQRVAVLIASMPEKDQGSGRRPARPRRPHTTRAASDTAVLDGRVDQAPRSGTDAGQRRPVGCREGSGGPVVPARRAWVTMFGQARSRSVLIGLRQPHDHRRRACSASRGTSLPRPEHDVTSCTRPANRTDPEHAMTLLEVPRAGRRPRSPKMRMRTAEDGPPTMPDTDHEGAWSA